MRVVALGFRCNNACIFCAQGKLREQSEAVDAAAAIAAVEPGDVVAFTGGEPTLHPELASMLRAVAARGATRVLVQTNGRRLAYEAYARELLAAAPCVSLDVSLQGSAAAMHDYHTSTPGSFGQTVTGLRHARALDVTVGISTVVTRSNFRHLIEIVRLSRALGARAIRFAPAVAAGEAARARDRVVPAPELVAPHLAAAAAEARRLGLEVVVEGRATSAAATGFFAGLGTIEVAAANDVPRRRLEVLGRPAPARAERRAPDRLTGDALRPLFPTLFEPDGSEPESPEAARRRVAGGG